MSILKNSEHVYSMSADQSTSFVSQSSLSIVKSNPSLILLCEWKEEYLPHSQQNVMSLKANGPVLACNSLSCLSS